jgi:hypothetical protein
MTMPLRKDKPDTSELSTADLAKAPDRLDHRQDVDDRQHEEVGPQRMKPVRSEHANADVAERRPPAAAEATALLPEGQLKELQSAWNNIQTSFVDEPRTAVRQADGLVASTMQQLANAFSRERTNLEQQWDRGDSVSTEDLRIAFQRYRSFFQRMLSL